MQFIKLFVLLFPSIFMAQPSYLGDYKKDILKADSLFKIREYLPAAKLYNEIFNKGLWITEDCYLAAQAWTIVGEKDSAFKLLDRLEGTEFENIQSLNQNLNLNALKEDFRWEILLNNLNEKLIKREQYYNWNLVKILDKVYNRDQSKERSNLNQTNFIEHISVEKRKQMFTEMRINDSINLGIVQSILDSFGWLPPSIISEKGNLTLFLVIQHADLKTQKKYYPIMQRAVKDHAANLSDLAYLEDRIAVSENRQQRYGTQLYFDTLSNRMMFFPIENPLHINDVRFSVGLGKIEDYCEYFNVEWIPDKKGNVK